MFSDNKQISLRQTFRLFVFDLLGASTLILPSFLSQSGFINGGLSIIIGTLFSVFYLLINQKALDKMGCDIITYLSENTQRKMWKKLVNKITIIYMILHGIMLSAFFDYIFTELIKINLVPNESYAILSAIIIFISAYAISGGVESRARVYEILFLFVLVPLLVMMIISARNITLDYLIPNLTSGLLNDDIISMTGGFAVKLLRNSYLVFASYTTLFCMLFFPKKIRVRQEKVSKRLFCVVFMALLLSSIILLLLYIDLIGNFGSKALSHMKFPVITLMSTIQIKGNFFNRIDSFMLGIWFFTMFALINMHLFYSSKLLQVLTSKSGKKRYIVTISLLTYIASLCLKYGDDIMNKYLRLLLYVLVPILVLIPVVIILAGCGANELENRCFPMLVAIDSNDKDQIQFLYKFPQSGIKSDNAKEAAKIDNPPAIAYDFMQAKSKFEESLTKIPDTNHLKVILLGERFIKDQMQYDYMLECMKEEDEFPRNAYVCVSDNPEEIIAYEQCSSMDIGGYLEEYLEKKGKDDKIKLTTIGNLMDESENQMLTLEIPYITISNNSLRWDNYYQIKNGIPNGISNRISN